MATIPRTEIEAFLAERRIALVGVSREQKEFSYQLLLDLLAYGYQAVPVNPNAKAIAGERCYAGVAEIERGVDAALLLTAPALNERVAAECAEAGVRRIWFYGVGDRSHENAAAIALCREQGIAVIPGFCPYMYLPAAALPHRLHGGVMRLVRLAPR